MSSSTPKRAVRGCTREGCTAPHRAKGLCTNHYYQAKRAARGLRRAAFLGPNPRRLEFAISAEKGAELEAHVGDGDMAAFCRRAVDMLMALEKSAGTKEAP